MKPRLLLNENMPIPAAQRLRATDPVVAGTAQQPDEPALWIEDLYARGALSEGHFCVFDGETLRLRPLANSPGRTH